MQDPGALPVAKTWFEIGPVDEYGVRRVQEPHANGGSIWLVEGTKRCLLVDTGIGVAPLKGVLETVTTKPIIAFASVGYYDHAGGLHQFDERLIHQEDAWRIRAPNRQSSVIEFYFDAALRAIPSQDFDPASYDMIACEPTRTLNDGDRIDLGDRYFDVLHLPGITNGTSGLFEPNTGVLFTGEAFVWNGTDVYDGEPATRSEDANRDAFCRSIQRLKKLPASAVYPGHGGRQDGHAMRQRIASYLTELSDGAGE